MSDECPSSVTVGFIHQAGLTFFTTTANAGEFPVSDTRPEKCPRCDSRDVRRSKPHFMGYMLYALLLKPYRCGKCKRQFWRLDSRRSTALLLWVIYIVAVAFVLAITWLALHTFVGQPTPPTS
jgi:transposase-like protein